MPKAIILEAASEVGRPTVFSMLIIILAHLPIFALQRQEGRIFAPMAYTVVSALIGSLLFSLTLVPMLSLFLLGKGGGEEDNRLVLFCKRLYRPVLQAALARRRCSSSRPPSACSPAASCWCRGSGPSSSRIERRGHLDQHHAAAGHLRQRNHPGSCARVRATIRKFPEVASVISKAGRPEDGTDPKMINMAEFLVDVKPQSAWRHGITKQDLIAQMNSALGTLPGIEPSFSQPIRDNVLESISQIDGQIVVKIFGDDTDELRRLAGDVLRNISTVPGVARAFVDRGGQVPQLQVEIDRARAARYGLNVTDVEDVIETELGGKTATTLWEGERQFPVVVRLGEDERRDPSAIRHVLVDTPSGLRVPLSEVAHVDRRQRQHEHRARIGHARGGHRRLHPGARHGRRRQRHAAAREAARHVPAGILRHMGRRVREPAAGDGAPQPHRSHQRAADLRPAVQRLRVGQARAR